MSEKLTMPKNVQAFVDKYGGVGSKEQDAAFWKEFRKAANAYANVQAKRICDLEHALAEARGQRDRLAGVLQSIRDEYGGQITAPDCYETMNDTPETDAATLLATDIEQGGNFNAVHVQVAKRLERQLDEARETVEALKATALSRLRSLSAAREELAEARGQLAEIEDKMRVELGGHPNSKLWGQAGLIAATMRCVDALGEVTDQRDKLAKVLRIIADGTNCRECGGEDEALRASEALQSLFCDALQSLTTNELSNQ